MAELPASIGPSLPSAALPASGSRGLQLRTGLSAIAAPPHSNSENKTRVQQVNNCCARVVGEQLLADWVQRPAATALLSLVLCWCGKSPANRSLLFSRPIQSCRCPKHPCHQRCLQLSLYKWSR